MKSIMAFKNVISRGRFEFTCSYGMLVIITVSAISFVLGQFTLMLIVLSSGI